MDEEVFSIRRSHTMDNSSIYSGASPRSTRRLNIDPENISITSQLDLTQRKERTRRRSFEGLRTMSAQAFHKDGNKTSTKSRAGFLQFWKKHTDTPSRADSTESFEVKTTGSASNLLDYRLYNQNSDPKLHLSSQNLSRHVSTEMLFGVKNEIFDRDLQMLHEDIDVAKKADTFTAPLMRTDISPFGPELEDEKLEEVYKAAVGCLLGKTPIDNSLPKERHLRKVFKLTGRKQNELLQQVEREQKPDVSLHVQVVEADRLIARKGHGKSDPYCKLAVIPKANAGNMRVDLAELRKNRIIDDGLIILQTEVKEYTLEPEWNQKFTIQAADPEGACLAVEVWDNEHKISLRKVKGFKGFMNYLKDLRGGNDFLGKVNIPLHDLLGGGKSEWYNLHSHSGNLRGRIHLNMTIDIKMKGVPQEVALEYFEKLFEVFCTYEATKTKSDSNPDFLDNMMESGMWAVEWSGQLCDTAQQFLTLFASRHGISELHQAIIQLSSLMKYHVQYGVGTAVFLQLYKVIVEDQDQLDLSESAMDQPAALRLVHKLASCTKSLSQDIHELIKKHPSKLSLSNAFDVEQFKQQIYLLKDLHRVHCFVKDLGEGPANLRAVVMEEIEVACSDWYSQTLSRAKKEASNKHPNQHNKQVLSLLSTVQTVAEYMTLSKDSLQAIFKELEINYYESVYMAVERKLAEELDDIIAQGPLDDVHSGYVLYLGLQEFKALSIHIEEKKHPQLRLPGFHRHFKGMVRDWIDLASQKLHDGIVKAASNVSEETVTEQTLFSVNARDLMDLVSMVCYFWKKLGWPEPVESYDFLIHLVNNLCNDVVFFAEKTCSQLVQRDFFCQQPNHFQVSQMLCIALNDIEQVRHGVHELPEFVALDNLKADLRDKGEPLADEVDGNINDIMTTMDGKIFAILGDICSQIVEKMRPGIKAGLKRVSEAQKSDNFDDICTPLMSHLHGNLQELRTSVFPSVFLKFLCNLWSILMEKMEKYANVCQRNNICSLYLYNLLDILYKFFHGDEEGMSKEELETPQYKKLNNMLMYRTMATEKLFQSYYQDLVEFQASAPTTRGTITLCISYIKEKQAIELKLIRAADLPAVAISKSCDCYMKISALPDKYFPNAERSKSRVYKRSRDPIFEEDFSFPSREHTLLSPGAVIMIEVYSHDPLKSHIPIGVVVVSCKDIPVLAPNTVPEDDELVMEPPKRKTMDLPIIIPYQSVALQELQMRPNGGETLKRINRLMNAGKSRTSTLGTKALNGFHRRLLKIAKS